MAEAPHGLLEARDLLLLGHVGLPLALELELAGDDVGAVVARPDADRRPCRARRSRPRVASSRWRSWEIITTAPSKSSSSAPRRSRRVMSRCASGSSSSSTSGRRARQAASATSLRWPPESSPWARRGPRCRARAGGRAPRPRRGRRRPRSSAPSSRSWRASARVIASRSEARRRVGEPRLGGVQLGLQRRPARAARRARCVSASRSSPSTICGRCASTSPRRSVTVPASGVSRPATIRISVDFPPPLGPRTPIREPASTSRSSAAQDRAPAEGLREPADGELRDVRHGG